MRQMHLLLRPLHMFVGRQECLVMHMVSKFERKGAIFTRLFEYKSASLRLVCAGQNIRFQHLFCWGKRESLSVLMCRRNSEKAMREVKEMEDRGLACLRLHAAKYVEALLPPSEPGSSQPCVPSAVRDFCEEAVKEPLQQEQMGLLSDPTAVRYCTLE